MSYVASPSNAGASEFKVYKPPTSTVSPPSEDLKAAQATLTARTQALTNAPLQLRATREAAEKAKRDRWPHTTVRVRFSDRTQLEKTFPSSDRIRSVYAFVHSSLRDDVKPVDFVLYQSPPKREFKMSDPKVRELSLSELQLAPSSVLSVRFEDEALNRSSVPAPLLPSIMAQATELPRPPALEETLQTQQGTSSKQPLSAKTGTKDKLPKWFKLGQRT
ncbi:hypothetical protein ID866_4978 [Astraeus odoratus]|nr:hypothetical protein ID866_4978 [Astraeus odoratus]